MAIVYASDVKLGNEDGTTEYVKKRGDDFSKGDLEKYFPGESAEYLLEQGVIVADTALPENVDDSRSLSYYELEAQMLRENGEAEDQGSQKQAKPPNAKAEPGKKPE